MNFMFSWQEQYLTSERSEQVSQRVRAMNIDENITRSTWETRLQNK